MHEKVQVLSFRRAISQNLASFFAEVLIRTGKMSGRIFLYLVHRAGPNRPVDTQENEEINLNVYV